MLSSSEGKKVPQITFPIRHDDEWQSITSNELFTDQTVVVFALPGAFTPTCSSTHLPRYNELAPVFKELGVDRVICLSVNDPFVMQAWAEDQHADNIEFIPDGNADFTREIGMLVSKSDIGFGDRSWRYSMLVKNGTIEKMFIEPDQPGDPFEVSDADTMLNYIKPDVTLPARVSLFTKPGCPHCTRAKTLLQSKGYKYEEITLGAAGLSYSTLQAVTGKGTTPQIFIDGQLIGGADELEAAMAKR